MIVAEIEIVTAPVFAHAHILHRVPYRTLDGAKAEYKRIADLITAKGNRSNGGGTLESVGDAGHKVTVPLATVHSVSLADYALCNEERAGMKDAFPRLFEKP